ncbi:hypothetical protein [uncultured Eubacterium sp.]|uniref:hypothetical protein n=1 Tax=uncultured Eubacterium sp. TaxID=165185 RepID=UPI002597B95A|nr:hypothetical protein [uncultured Eubacterium sp.]
MTEYILKKDFDSYKESTENKIVDIELKQVSIEANLKHMQNTLNVILGALVSGVGSIIVILLTRGIK